MSFSSIFSAGFDATRMSSVKLAKLPSTASLAPSTGPAGVPHTKTSAEGGSSHESAGAPDSCSAGSASDFHMAASNCRMFVAATASPAKCSPTVSNSSPLALSSRAVSKIASDPCPPKSCLCSVAIASLVGLLCNATRLRVGDLLSGRLTRGSSLLMSGRTSTGSSTSLHMLSTMRQQVRLTSSDSSFRQVAASVGVSTF